MISTRKQLMALVRGERHLAILEGWRRDMAGQGLLALLEGKCSISVSGDSLRLEGIVK